MTLYNNELDSPIDGSDPRKLTWRALENHRVYIIGGTSLFLVVFAFDMLVFGGVVNEEYLGASPMKSWWMKFRME